MKTIVIASLPATNLSGRAKRGNPLLSCPNVFIGHPQFLDSRLQHAGMTDFLRSLRPRYISWWVLAMTVLLCVFSLTAKDLAYSNMIQRLDAHVAEVEPKSRKLVVEFQHPVSGEAVRKEFLVAENAGFKRVKNLTKVKKGDLVTIDYREENEQSVAIYIDIVPIERRPVTAGELAASMVQIRSAQKSPATKISQAPERNILEEAIHYRRLGKWDLAIERYQRALEQDPADPILMREIGVVYLEARKYQEAFEWLEKSLARDPESAETEFYLGQVSLGLSDTKSAKAHFTRALERNPAHAYAAYGLALILDFEGDHGQAQRILRRVAAENPNMTDVFDQLGSIAYGNNDYPAAEEAYERITAVDPKNVAAHYNLGLACVQQKKWERAREAFKRVYELDPSQAKALFQIGYTYEGQGFYDEARTYYRDYLVKDPSSFEVRERLNAVEEKMEIDERQATDFSAIGPNLFPAGQLGFESQLPFDRFGGLFGSGNTLQGGNALFQSGLAILNQLLQSRSKADLPSES